MFIRKYFQKDIDLVHRCEFILINPDNKFNGINEMLNEVSYRYC